MSFFSSMVAPSISFSARISIPDAMSFSRTSFWVAGVLACGLTKTKAEFFKQTSSEPALRGELAETFDWYVKTAAVATKRRRSAAREAMVEAVTNALWFENLRTQARQI